MRPWTVGAGRVPRGEDFLTGEQGKIFTAIRQGKTISERQIRDADKEALDQAILASKATPRTASQQPIPRRATLAQWPPPPTKPAASHVPVWQGPPTPAWNGMGAAYPPPVFQPRAPSLLGSIFSTLELLIGEMFRMPAPAMGPYPGSPAQGGMQPGFPPTPPDSQQMVFSKFGHGSAAWQRPVAASMPAVVHHKPLGDGANSRLNYIRPTYSDAHRVGKPERIGKGHANTVYDVWLRDPGGGGGVSNYAFKPLTYRNTATVGFHVGIDEHHPQFELRNLSVDAYDKALKFNVTPGIKMGVLSVPESLPEGGEGPSRPQFGMVMDKARGRSLASLSPAELERPDVMRAVTRYQWLCHLTGAADCHDTDILVDTSVHPAKVTGVDNDLCFGKDLKDPNGISANGRERLGFRGTRMPPLIDEEWAEEIRKLDPASLVRKELGQPTIDAAVELHRQVKLHIAELEKQGRVIKKSDDPKEKERNWKAKRHLLNADNSIAARASDRVRLWRANAWNPKMNGGNAAVDAGRFRTVALRAAGGLFA